MKLRFTRLASLVFIITLSLFAPRVNAQYCTPLYFQGCALGGSINDFFLNGESGTSINDPATGCPMGSGFGGYEDRTTEFVTLNAATTYTITATSALCPVGPSNFQVWIDFDNSNVFDASESIGGGVLTTSSTNIPITIPSGVTAGTYRMRAEVSVGQTYPGIDPCPAGTPPSYSNGEVHDYMVTIVSGTVTACSTPTVTLGATGCSSQVINWTNGGISSVGSSSEWAVDNSSGSPVGAGTAVTGLTATATGLTPSTLYYAHVRHSCGGGSYSAWVTVSFTTAAGPAGITGSATVCPSGTTNLSDVTSGGTWSTGNASFATVTNSGVVYGVAVGSANISYTLGSCSVSVLVTVAALPGITGTTSMCTSSTSQLNDATSGGVWTSSNPSVATISSTGLVYSTTTSGNTTITYTAGGCSTTVVVTVGALPPITGNTTLCPGSTTQLSDATSGGFWGSSNTSVATIGQTTGIVYSGATAGTTTVVYGTSASCTATVTITVASLPAIIADGNTVCVGLTTQLSDATSGGVWSSSNANATVSGTGVVTGSAVGSVTITYTLGSCYVTKVLTVGNSIAPITGNTTFCVTSTTALSDATSGGTWSSSNNAVASVTGTVVVHGVTAGTATISYTSGGCSATAVVTVDPNNGGTITGKDSICKGTGHVITLSDNAAGGVWSSNATTRATVDPATGVVTAIANGPNTVTISYVVTNTCGTYTATYVVHLRSATQCATGVEPLAQQDMAGLKVFPNPNGGAFTMNLTSDIDEEVHVIIANLVGEKVSEFTTATNKLFDIRLNSAPGIYLLSASTAHGRYVTKVVVEK